MGSRPRIPVVVVCAHALLGQGLVRLLATEHGLDVAYVAASDREAVERSLAEGPRVVVYERSDSLDVLEIMRLVPNALLIDISLGLGPTWKYQREQIPGSPEGIVRAIRGLRRDPGHAIRSSRPGGGMEIGAAAASGLDGDGRHRTADGIPGPIPSVEPSPV